MTAGWAWRRQRRRGERPSRCMVFLSPEWKVKRETRYDHTRAVPSRNPGGAFPHQALVRCATTSAEACSKPLCVRLRAIGCTTATSVNACTSSCRRKRRDYRLPRSGGARSATTGPRALRCRPGAHGAKARPGRPSHRRPVTPPRPPARDPAGARRDRLERAGVRADRNPGKPSAVTTPRCRARPAAPGGLSHRLYVRCRSGGLRA